MKKKYFLLSLIILAGLSLSSCSLIKSYSSRKASNSSSRVSLRDDSDTSSSSRKEKDSSKTTGTRSGLALMIMAILVFLIIGLSLQT